MTTHHGSAIRDVCECDCMRVSLMDDKEPHPSGARLSRRGGCECEVLWDGGGGGVHSDNQSERTYERT